jgi:hypothetical protein
MPTTVAVEICSKSRLAETAKTHAPHLHFGKAILEAAPAARD